MPAESRSVVVRLGMDVANAIRGAKQFGDATEREMSRAEKSVAKTDRAMDDLGNRSGKVALGAATALGLMGKAAVDWESQFAGVTKTVDGTSAQMQQLEEDLRGLATTLPATHEEIAGVAEAAGQLGVAREDIVSFTKTMIDLGETTNLTAEEAATSIAQISNVMGTAGDDVDNFGSALVALGNDGASTEKQILDMTQRIAGAGAQIGLTEADILAIANAASSMGIEAEAGGSSISRVFTELAKATKSQTPLLETFADTAGMSAAAFTEAFEKDPARAFASFTAGLDQINKSGGDVFSVLDSLGLSDVRVSQALLSMSASGDLLTDSLDLGAQAWTENTALANEAAKRYDTTASEIQVAWNKIKDAGISAGEAILPVLAEGADLVGDFADAFSALPQPIQGSLTGLLAITAVFGGGLWFTTKVIGGISSMRNDLDALGFTGDKTAGSLGKVTKAAGIAGATLAAVSIADSLQRQFDGVDVGLESLTGKLLGLASGGGVSQLSNDFDGLGDSFERLTDKNVFQDFQDGIYDTFSFLGSDSNVDKAVAQFEALDAGLTNVLATAGSADAQAAFDGLASSLGLSAGEQEKLLDLLPQYKDAMAGVASETERAANAKLDPLDVTADVLGLQNLGDAAGETAGEVEDLAGEFDSLNAALTGRAAWRDYEAAIDAVKDSLKENGRTLDRTTDAGRNNAAALDTIAGRAASLAETLKGVDKQRFLNRARSDFIATARTFGMGKAAAQALANEVGLLGGSLDKVGKKKPKPKVTVEANDAYGDISRLNRGLLGLDGQHPNPKVTVSTEAADSQIASLRASLRNIPDELVLIQTRLVGQRAKAIDGIRGANGLFLSGARSFADGGMDVSNGHQPSMNRRPGVTPRMWLEEETRGETYIPHANDARRPRAKAILQETAQLFGGDVLWFADGGSTGERRGGPTGGVNALNRAAGDASRGLQGLKRSLNQSEKALDREKSKRDRLVSDRDSLSSDVTGNFRTDLFGGNDVWGASGGWKSTLKTDIAEGRAFQADLRKLKRMGLDGQALAEIARTGDVRIAREFASMDKGSLGEYERLYNQRRRVSSAVGETAGNAVYGAAVRAQTKELRTLNRKIDRLEHAIKDAGPKATGREVGKAVNGAARDGKRGQKK